MCVRMFLTHPCGHTSSHMRLCKNYLIKRNTATNPVLPFVNVPCEEYRDAVTKPERREDTDARCWERDCCFHLKPFWRCCNCRSEKTNTNGLCSNLCCSHYCCNSCTRVRPVDSSPERFCHQIVGRRSHQVASVHGQNTATISTITIATVTTVTTTEINERKPHARHHQAEDTLTSNDDLNIKHKPKISTWNKTARLREARSTPTKGEAIAIPSQRTYSRIPTPTKGEAIAIANAVQSERPITGSGSTASDTHQGRSDRYPIPEDIFQNFDSHQGRGNCNCY
ncbi:hypothetical protein B0T19DRAFT_476413 [Cercophora scortea]|uniref:Uncharacterized protein n=1 Tax=Cercophora scortea TaxID=314031 RepID=A0AAE0IE63_9PEZI|nr:hypothetical protein B0T19DRAFT_476413 [Cercophora scortea]